MIFLFKFKLFKGQVSGKSQNIILEYSDIHSLKMAVKTS